MVEFAIITGLVLTPLMLGILSFGFAARAKNSANVADSFAVRSFVTARTSLETSGPNAIRVHARWPNGNSQGDIVEVSVVHPVPRRDPFFIPAHTDSAVSKMRIIF